MDGARHAPGLLAGMALLDILLNLPGFSPAAPLASLLAPSLDLLIALALLMTAPRGSPRVRTGFAVAVAVLAALLIGLEAFRRWGAPEAGRLSAQAAFFQVFLLGIAAVVVLAAVGVASFFLARLVLRGFEQTVLRSVFLLAAALCAVIQALLGARIFSASAVPGIVKAVGHGFR